MRKADNYYFVQVIRQNASLGGILQLMISGIIFADSFGYPDWKCNYVKIIDKSDQCVRLFAYRWNAQGAKAKKELIEEDLEKLSKEDFEYKYFDSQIESM